MKDFNEVFKQITPDPYDSIQAQLQNRKEEIIVEPMKRNRKMIYAIPAVIIVMIFAFVFLTKNESQVIATVGLDVNPSIAIDVDNQNKIVKVKANNQDGEKIIGSMKLEGSDIEVGTNALIGSMLKHGYIDELKNSLLISVTGDNQEKNEQLRQTLSMQIDEYLKGSQVNGSILSQTVTSQSELEKLASQYQISIGKAEVIQELIQKNSRYTFEQLKDLSVNDLNILLHKNSVDIHTTGSEASEGSYIGDEKAKQIAFTDAKVSKPTYQKVELDCDDGQMIYEVEFSKNGVKYEYDIDAVNGKILKKEKEGHENTNSNNHSNSQTNTNNQTSTSQTNVTEAKAKSIAMNHAGVKSVSQYQLKKDYDDGRLEYEIEFVSGEYKYEYTIRASDGRVLDHEKEYIGNVKITLEEAKKKAFNHAGVSASQARDVDVELKKNYYEVSFQVGQYEYEYHIDSANGSVLSHEKERD